MRLSYDVNGELANKIIIDWRKKKIEQYFVDQNVYVTMVTDYQIKIQYSSKAPWNTDFLKGFSTKIKHSAVFVYINFEY